MIYPTVAYGDPVLKQVAKDIPQGEEIFITYGDENTNEYLLTHYGFVLPKNTAEMKVSIKTE